VKRLGSDFEEFVLEMLLKEMGQQPEVRTRYDAMNLVTAAAREVRDPELKWRMESLATTLLRGAESERKALPTFRERELAGV
jgi:hypothetical protein